MLELPLAERGLLEPGLLSGAMFLTLDELPAKTMSTAGLSVLAKHYYRAHDVEQDYVPMCV